jgi:photosystem II stability/assembly factor-like uncharacterized protein
MNVIRIGLGLRELTSEDGGATWSTAPRAEPAEGTPWLRGAPRSLPVVDAGWVLDGVFVGESGIGLAAAHEPRPSIPGKRGGVAQLFRSEDHGQRWSRIEPRLSPLGRAKARYSWPPEKIQELAVQPDGVMAFAWTDPWLFDDADSHVVVSRDAGRTWRYTRVPGMCAELAVSRDAVVRIVGAGEIWSRGPGAREHLRWTWASGDDAGFGAPGLLRRVCFLSAQQAMGLVVAFPQERVGLARTRDGGRTWGVEASWDGVEHRRHINERGVLGLEVDAVFLDGAD